MSGPTTYGKEPQLSSAHTLWLKALPWVFVLIWSTGFIVAKVVLPNAPSLGFLVVRYALSLLAFVLLAWAFGLLPKLSELALGRNAQHLLVVGLLTNAGYLGGVWMATRYGMGAGLTALIMNLQPLLTLLWLAYVAKGVLHTREVIGVLLGLLGVFLVVAHKLHTEVTPLAALNIAMALLSMTVGALYQKRFAGAVDFRVSGVYQFAASLAVTLPFAFFEAHAWQFHWTPELMGAMVWAVLGLTLGGSSLFYVLIQSKSTTQATSLLYLVPPTTALMAWWMFGEPLSEYTLTGFALTAWAVALVTQAKKTESGPSKASS